jgi:integrase
MFITKPEGTKYWHLGFWDPEKKRTRTRSLKTTDKKEAERKLKIEQAKATLDIDDARFGTPTDKRYKLSDAQKKFIESRDIKPKTITAYTTAIKKFKEICGDKLLSKYTREDYNLFISKLKSQEYTRNGVARRGLARNSKANYTIHLSSFFEWCKENKLVKENIIKIITPVQQDVKPIPPEDMEQIFKKLLDFGMNERRYVLQQRVNYYHFFKIKYLAALRLQEDINVMVEDFDFKFNVMYVRNNKGERTDMIPLPEDLITYLNSMDLPVSGPLFPTITYDGVRCFWRRFKTKNKIKYHMHQFRATRGTDLANQGVHALFLQQFMRHKKFETTQKHYIYINRAKAKANIDASFGAGKTSIVSSSVFSQIQTRLDKLSTGRYSKKAQKL